MSTKIKYRNCPKCGLNYITGSQTLCTVCESVAKTYRGKYCRECSAKSGIYDVCFNCHKTRNFSNNDRRAAAGYRTDRGMLGARTRDVCEICGSPAYSRLCGRCYMSTRYSEDKKDDSDD